MSTAKVIFTYKRKRLSSHSGVGHADDCADFSLDAQVDKHQDAPIEKLKSPDKDVTIFKCANCNDVPCSMNCQSCLDPFDNQCTGLQHQHVCCGEKVAVACSSLPLHHSSNLGEKHDVQTSNTTISRETILGSHGLPVDNTFKTSGENVSAGASVGETMSSIEKDSCLNSSYQDNGGCILDDSVSQSVEKEDILLLTQSFMSKTEVAEGKLSAPLRTFSRRLKRKADTCGIGMFMEQPLREGDAAIKKCDFGPVTSCTCELASKHNRLNAKSDIKVEGGDADMRNMFCQSSEKMVSRESSCPYGRSCGFSFILRHTEGVSNSREDLVADTSLVTKQTSTRTPGSIASVDDCPNAAGGTGLQNDDIRCSPCDGIVISSLDVTCNMDEQPVSQQLRASSGDSQLTSSDSSDLKTGVAKRVEHRACSNSLDLSHPPSGAFVIDCNVVPESDVQEEASDIIQDSSMAKNSEKGKCLDLFDNSVQDSPHDVNTSSIKTESKPQTNYLQLFSEDDKCGPFKASHTDSEIGHSKGQQNVAFITDSQKHQVEQSSSEASAILGLSLPTRPICEGQTSKDGLAVHQTQKYNVRTCDLIQNPGGQSFPDQAFFRHKLVLESINTRATSLRGNRNISLDKFQPCPGVWSEEELDSLWIGIRRHGKGNWHAMLLDPRLRFAPWRVAVDLEKQWEQEQNMLFSGKVTPSSRYHMKPKDAHKVHCHGPVTCHGIDDRRENVAAETQLSLGDVYTQKNGSCFRSDAKNVGNIQPQSHVTMASRFGSYACGSFNTVQTSVMIRGEASPDGPAMAFGMHNCLPHWLRDSTSTPSRLPLDPPLPPISTHPQMGGLRFVHAFPEPSCWGKNLINTKLAGMNAPNHVNYGSSLIRKPDTADNPIIINSDASSEETISDDHNIRS